MKRIALLAALSVFAFQLGLLADDAAKNEVKQAAEKLTAQENYSWTSTMTGTRRGETFEFVVQGQTEKDGYTMLTIPRDQQETQVVIKGNMGAVKTDTGWQSVQELSQGENRGRFLAAMVQNYRTPAAEVTRLTDYVKDLTKSGDTYSGTLTDEGARELMTFGGLRNATVNRAEGNVKMSLKDGALTGYEVTLKGSVRFNDNDFDIDRTTKVEVKDVGSTKLTVPQEAQAKLK